MDSGNSGSLQSSSGGDEEYDSRANASVSAFISNPPPPFFDPFSSFLQLHQDPINPGSIWPRTTLRSDPSPITHDIISPMLPSSSSTFIPSFQPASGADNSSQTQQKQTAARNPKKRSRASRRAPTTVLTTDTTNFRAMVQEFTGIPAPPFDSSSINFPIRSRLDLLGTRSSPPYLRRPFAQKVQPPFLTSSINYQLPITQTSSNLFNINNQNPLLTSILQSNPKSPISNSPLLIEQFGLNQVSANIINHPSDHSHNAARWRNNPYPVSPDAADKKEDGGYNFNQRNTTTTTSFQGGKGPPAEGMVESWICSSE